MNGLLICRVYKLCKVSLTTPHLYFLGRSFFFDLFFGFKRLLTLSYSFLIFLLSGSNRRSIFSFLCSLCSSIFLRNLGSSVRLNVFFSFFMAKYKKHLLKSCILKLEYLCWLPPQIFSLICK